MGPGMGGSRCWGKSEVHWLLLDDNLARYGGSGHPQDRHCAPPLEKGRKALSLPRERRARKKLSCRQGEYKEAQGLFYSATPAYRTKGFESKDRQGVCLPFQVAETVSGRAFRATLEPRFKTSGGGGGRGFALPERGKSRIR